MGEREAIHYGQMDKQLSAVRMDQQRARQGAEVK